MYCYLAGKLLIVIIQLKNTTLAPDELCGKGSLLTLAARIEERFNFTPKCIDDPKVWSISSPPLFINIP